MLLHNTREPTLGHLNVQGAVQIPYVYNYKYIYSVYNMHNTTFCVVDRGVFLFIYREIRVSRFQKFLDIIRYMIKIDKIITIIIIVIEIIIRRRIVIIIPFLSNTDGCFGEKLKDHIRKKNIFRQVYIYIIIYTTPNIY